MTLKLIAYGEVKLDAKMSALARAMASMVFCERSPKGKTCSSLVDPKVPNSATNFGDY